jgi:hypothetical protein
MQEVSHFRFPTNTGGKSKYDWDTILNGKTWELSQGEDFEMEPRTFVAHVHGTAKRRGLKARTHTKDARTIIVRAYKEKVEVDDSVVVAV